ncbi:hypothetical protein, conserved [Leishmania tarentolae]|uniref:BRCT domain-containing protein n=1 Tax=Leishmania tarentolae TaxID=5689 RepID=A0A640KI21_LEITA|nr:hypothetical protein, conserved [Leishmania tarentolae]
MWGGLHFFVSIETLVSFAIPSSLCDNGAKSMAAETGDKACAVKRAGNPTVRRLHFTRERRLTSVFAFPNATLFLQVLFSSGNKVHLMTPWDKEDTTTILKSFGWVNFLADARRVSVVPGSKQFSFSSLGVDLSDYTRTVLVVEDASRWSSATSMQLMEVCHTRERQDVADSMELLYALSRCILFSEWYLRYPSSSIASCAALSNTTIFAFCRFFLDGAAGDVDLMQLICYHGGRVVHTASEATHVLVLPSSPTESDASSSTSSSSASSSTSSGDHSGSESEELDSCAHSTNTDTSDEDGEGSTSSVPQKKGEGSAGESNAPHASFVAAALGTMGTSSLPPSRPSTATLKRPAPDSNCETLASTNQSSSMMSSAATNGSPQPAIVTRTWVYRCIRALRLIPLDCTPATSPPCADEEEGHRKGKPDGGDIAEVTRTTGALLCALLPPADARPLLWTTLQSIASQHGYDTAALVHTTPTASPLKAVTAACVLEALTSPVYSDMVEVRLQPPLVAGKPTDTSLAASRSRGVPVTRRTLDSLKLSTASSELGRIALHRFERRRDKEAVFAHLQLIASQFLYSFDYVQRQRSQLLHCHAGTQTSGVRRAFMGTMTEAQWATSSRLLPTEEEVLVGEKGMTAAVTGDAKLKEREPASSWAMTAAPSTSDAAGAVDEKEWRHHLRNVEGKLLVSHVHTSERSDKEPKHFSDTSPCSQCVSDADVCAKAVRAPAMGHIEYAEKTEIATAMIEEGLNLAPPYSPKIASETSREQTLPARPPSAPSLLKPPSSLLPLPATAKPIHNGCGGANASLAEFTACLIPTSVLTTDQQCDFYAFLRSLPLFDSAELGNSVMRVADGVRCQFADHKGAKDFLRIEFIEFLSLHLPIYPALDDSIDVEDLHKTIMDFPFLPPLTAAEVSQEEGNSLWTAPAPPEAPAFASPPATFPGTVYPSETGRRPLRRSPSPPSVKPKSPTNRGRDAMAASRAVPQAPRSDLRPESRRKRDRSDKSTEEPSLPAVDHSFSHRYRRDRHRSSPSRHAESVPFSHRRHRDDDRGDRHRLLRDKSVRDSRSSGHHRQRSRRERR